MFGAHSSGLAHNSVGYVANKTTLVKVLLSSQMQTSSHTGSADYKSRLATPPSQKKPHTKRGKKKEKDGNPAFPHSTHPCLFVWLVIFCAGDRVLQVWTGSIGYVAPPPPPPPVYIELSLYEIQHHNNTGDYEKGSSPHNGR
jgi:hypothetical protein